jgi:hypothetical protein
MDNVAREASIELMLQRRQQQMCQESRNGIRD